MSFIGEKYLFKNNNDDKCIISINETNNTYTLVLELYKNTNNIYSKQIDVKSIKHNYIETDNIYLDEDEQLNIQNIPVNAFKIKCKFKDKNISKISSVIVLHKNYKHWVTYPIDYCGEIHLIN